MSRRWLIVLLLLLIGLAVAAIFWQSASPYLAESRAEIALSAGGAEVETQPAEAGWIRAVLGEDRCIRIVGISLRDKSNVDDLLASAKPCRHLRWVQLANTDVGDAGLSVLADKTSLESVEIFGSARVPCPVTDAGVRHLGGLTKLERLAITDAAITDDSLTTLADLKGIQNLSLHRTQITGETLAELAKLPKLKWLHLNGTPLADASLAAADKLRNLEHLSLTNSAITDAALEHLAKLRFLDRLSIGGTRITDAGRDRLKAALRGVTIDF